MAVRGQVAKLGGRVKPDHGEKEGIARGELSSIHPVKAVIQMINLRRIGDR